MDLRTVLANNFNFQNLIFKGISVVFIALFFEMAVWWLGRVVEKMTAPLLAVDQGREAGWRVRRRALLRQAPRWATRALCYTVALILVFSVFGAPVLELGIAVAATVGIIGAAMLPALRDAAQGYSLLSEDVLAVGDVVEIANRQGTVERFTLRGTWLRDSEGHGCYFSNGEVKNVVVLRRKAEDASKKPLQDPNALPDINLNGRDANANAQNAAPARK